MTASRNVPSWLRSRRARIDLRTGSAATSLAAWWSRATHIVDPLQRVRLASLSTAIAKENNELFGPDLYGKLIAYLPPIAAPPVFSWLARRNAKNRLFNIPISNVAGPRERGQLAGAPVSEIYSAVPLMAACGINITVWSYVDQLNISVTADRTLGDTHEATDAMVREFCELRSAAGLPDGLSEVESRPDRRS